MANCEGAFLPIGSRDRKPPVSLRWCAWSSSFARSLPPSLPLRSHSRRGAYLWLDRAEPSRAERSGTRQKKLAGGCGTGPPSPSCHPPLQPQSEDWTRSRCCLPAAVRVPKLRRELAWTRVRTHARTHKCPAWPSKEQPQGDPVENRK